MKEGKTPLMCASDVGTKKNTLHNPCLDILIQNGADLDMQDRVSNFSK